MPLPTMHLRSPQGKTNLCCHQGLVAIASSNEAFIFRATALKVKRPNQEKVTKDRWGSTYFSNTVA
jgi:hypothetical protein